MKNQDCGARRNCLSSWKLWLVLIAWLGIAHPTVAEPPPATGQDLPRYWVHKIDNLHPSLGDTIEVTVENLKGWITEQTSADKTPRSQWDLVLFFNGMPLRGITPDSINTSTNTYKDGNGTAYQLDESQLRFTLRRTPDSKVAWSALLHRPAALDLPIDVSIGFPDTTTPMSSNVLKKDDSVRLVIIPTLLLSVGCVIMAVSLWICLSLARRTDLLRDTTSPPKPDGWKPFSLAKCQMAFWFFLVIGSYFFLWIITHDKDTITTSILGLIGISAGTALGAAIVDGGKQDPVTSVERQNRITNAKERKVRLSSIQAMIGAIDKAVVERQALIHAATSPADIPAMEAKQRDDLSLKSVLRVQEQYFQLSPWRRFTEDLLSENGAIAFHRFQIAVWTIVLGIIFVSDVYNELSMPQFSGTLLALMGISSGTYIGFKLSPGTPSKQDDRAI